MNEIFGTATFSRAMGYSYFIKLPFLFGPAPLAGWLYDLSGGYGSTYAACVGGIAIAALLAVVLGIANRRHMPGAAVPAPS
jgi:hypothetical protein